MGARQPVDERPKANTLHDAANVNGVGRFHASGQLPAAHRQGVGGRLAVP